MALPPRTVCLGNPPTSTHQIDQTELADYLEAQEAIVGALPSDSDFAALEAADTALDGRVSDLESLGGTGAQYASGGPVACATTANITLSGEQTIDGVTTSASRVLVKNQSTASANGIYVTGAGAWARGTDMNAADEVAGTAVFVSGGTVNGLKSYATYSEVATLGTDAIAFVEIANNSGVAAALALKAPLASPAFTGSATLDGDDLVTAPELATVAGAEALNTAFRGDIEEIIIDEDVVGIAWAVTDPAGRAALSVRDDGTVAAGALDLTTLNGTPVADLIGGDAYGGTFMADMVYFNNTGQSLGEGSNDTITSAQEYDNLGFPARSNVPTSTVTLTVANTEVSGRGESPMYGAMGHIKELIAEENGIAYTEQAFQLVACNNSYGGQRITTFKKPRNEFGYSITQMQATYDIAQAAGKTAAAGAVFWTQGESDTTTTYADYLADMLTLATDHNTDLKAISGQSTDVPFITYQTASMATKDVALAQLAAAVADNNIYMACPMYQFTYYDAQHINAESSKWLGAYYGLVYKRVVIDGLDWTPVRPISHIKQGKVARVKFHVPAGRLTIDTTQVAAQTNYGFTLVDSGGSALTISSVTLSGPDTVTIAASATIPVGAKLRYAFGGALAKGNLRDSQGDSMTYSAIDKPMHNWCVIFEYDL